MTNEPLNSIPGRHAGSTIRGFLYQFWKTVEAWIDIGPEEKLFVEGAEDFDVVTNDEGTSFQIKDTKLSSSLTLNNSDALKALSNFWQHKTLNPGVKIRYKYITTSTPGKEKDGAFDKPGIFLWESCQKLPLTSSLDQLEKIIDFLKQKKDLQKDLYQFICKAQPEQILNELVSPFEWLYNQPSIEDLYDMIIGKIVQIGNQRGLTVKDAENLAAKLCLTVQNIAVTKSPKPLNYIDFMTLLDNEVNLELPREIVRLFAGGHNIIAGSSFYSNYTQTTHIDASQFTPPMLKKDAWPRKKLLDNIQTLLSDDKTNIICIHGGTGYGKTTLVLQAISQNENIFWADLRGKNYEQICLNIDSIIKGANNKNNPIIVFDDFNPDCDLRLFETPVGRLLSAIPERKSKLIIVSYRPLGQRFSSLFGINSSYSILIPLFNQDEIQELLCNKGCPESMVEDIGKLIWDQTSGHPQLVDARIKSLENKQFQIIEPATIFETPSVFHDEQTNLIRTLNHLLSDDARTLLYRLSLSITLLSHNQVLRLGATSPPIKNSGEILAILIGPWLEEPHKQHFRVSPLIANIGEKIYSEEELKTIHAEISNLLTIEGTLSAETFSAIIHHAIKGEAEQTLVKLVFSFLNQSNEIKNQYYPYLGWLCLLAVPSAEVLRPFSKVTRQIFRLFQWEVSSKILPKKLEDLAYAMEVDFQIDNNTLEELSARIVYLTNLLLAPDINLRIEKIIDYCIDYNSLNNSVFKQSTMAAENKTITPTKQVSRNVSEIFSFALILRLRKTEQLNTLINKLTELNDVERNSLLDSIKENNEFIGIFFSFNTYSADLDESGKVEVFLNILKMALELGWAWHHVPWIHAVGRAISSVLDEVFDDSKEAEKIIQEIIKKSNSSLLLKDQLACISYNKSDYKNALKIWNKFLFSWNSNNLLFDARPLWSSRLAAISATYLKKWDLAIAYYERAISLANQASKFATMAGLFGDMGFVLWIQGNKSKAANAFFEAVKLVEGFQNDPKIFLEFAVRKLIAYILTYIAIENSGFEHPVPGMCSAPKPHQGISGLPPVPNDYIWFSLYKISLFTNKHDVINFCEEKVNKSSSSVVKMLFSADGLNRTLASRNLTDLLVRAEKLAQSLKELTSSEEMLSEQDNQQFMHLAKDEARNSIVHLAVIAGILQANFLGLKLNDLMNHWETEIKEKYEYILDDFKEIQSIGAIQNTEELSIILAMQHPEIKAQFLASVFMLGNSDILPIELIYAQSIFVIRAVNNPFLKEFAEPIFCRLFISDWKRMLREKSYGFKDLSHKKLIVNLLSNQICSWQNIAKTMILIRDAVDKDMSMEITKEILIIAQGWSKEYLESGN